MKPIYAIRHKPTGHFLPARKSNRRGFSFDEPLPSGGALGPRVFYSKQSAMNALTAWLQGKFKADTTYSYEGEADYAITVDPQPHRVRSDMEIVTYQMIEVE